MNLKGVTCVYVVQHYPAHQRLSLYILQTGVSVMFGGYEQTGNEDT